MITRQSALSAALLTGAVLLAPPLPSRAQTKTPASTATAAKPNVSAPNTAVYARPVAKGVNLTQEVVPEGSPDGPLVVTVIRINPREAGVKIEAALGGDRVWGTDPTFGREAVSTMAVRHNAVAGVNAGFFPFMGNPLGLHIQNGEMVTEPMKNRSVFFLDQAGRPHIGAFSFLGTVKMEGDDKNAVVLNGLNRKPDKSDGLLLYTPIFFDNTLRSPNRVEVVVPLVGPLVPNHDYSGVPASLSEGGQTPIAPGTVVLSASGDDASSPSAALLRRAFETKKRLVFRLNVTPLPQPGATDAPPVDFADVRDAVTGAPRLLTDGKVTIALKEEGMGAAFSTTRHPRTAVGITDNGDILLVTVDGRQKNLSRGASLPELAALLLKYGAVQAVNLDGGGSSACVVRGMVVNSPSEGKERPIADALLVRADNLPSFTIARGQGSRLYIPSRPLKTGETWNFLPYTDRAPAADLGVWGTRGGVGFVFQNGEYRAQRPGKGEVFFAPPDGRLPLSTPLTIVGANTGDAAGFAAKLTLTPDPTNPLKAQLFIHVANAEGDPLASEVIAVTVAGGKADAPTVTTDRKGDAQIAVTWDAKETRRETVVSSPAKRFGDAALLLTPPVMVPPKPGS